MKVNAKTLIITGAGSGIGRALALELIKSGSIVIAVDINEANLDSLRQDIGAEHQDRLITYKLDISNRLSVEEFYNTVAKDNKLIDGLINCAGVIQPFTKIINLEYNAIDKVMNINFYGTIYMTKTFLPHLLDRPVAHIVNVSSMGGFLPVPGQGIYGASKAAVKLFTEALYAELLGTNVNVSVVFPGATATNITANSGVEPPKIEGTQNYKALSPADVAKQIIKGIENNKPQIFTGKDSKAMNNLYRVSPIYATKLIAKKMSSLLASN